MQSVAINYNVSYVNFYAIVFSYECSYYIQFYYLSYFFIH